MRKEHSPQTQELTLQQQMEAHRLNLEAAYLAGTVPDGWAELPNQPVESQAAQVLHRTLEFAGSNPPLQAVLLETEAVSDAEYVSFIYNAEATRRYHTFHGSERFPFILIESAGRKVGYITRKLGIPFDDFKGFDQWQKNGRQNDGRGVYAKSASYLLEFTQKIMRYGFNWNQYSTEKSDLGKLMPDSHGFLAYHPGEVQLTVAENRAVHMIFPLLNIADRLTGEQRHDVTQRNAYYDMWEQHIAEMGAAIGYIRQPGEFPYTSNYDVLSDAADVSALTAQLLKVDESYPSTQVCARFAHTGWDENSVVASNDRSVAFQREQLQGRAAILAEIAGRCAQIGLQSVALRLQQKVDAMQRTVTQYLVIEASSDDKSGVPQLANQEGWQLIPVFKNKSQVVLHRVMPAENYLQSEKLAMELRSKMQ